MARIQLIIGNKNYSSWSLRGWLALRQANIDFEETVIGLYQETTQSQLAEFSPTRKVPVMIEGGVAVWESLAIVERANELSQSSSLWPTEPTARAVARSVAAEMHAGFGSLRSQCPMNIRRQVKNFHVTAELEEDLNRFTSIVSDCRRRFGQSGPFLFGDISGADVMLAPVCSRLKTYQLPVDKETASYRDAVLNLPAVLEWTAAAMLETWVIEASEVH